jgi:Domain of unknown function (DUF4252)
MRRTVLLSFLLLIGAGTYAMAQLKINLDNLASKAKEVVDLSLDSSTLQVAGRFLSSEKSDEAKVKALISGLKGVYVKNYEFEKEGDYTQADLEPIRAQLQAPGWSRIVNVVERREGTEIYVNTEEGKTAGLVILAWERRELSFVNIVGNIDLDQLSELGGRFGIPPVPILPAKPVRPAPPSPPKPAK